MRKYRVGFNGLCLMNNYSRSLVIYG